MITFNPKTGFVAEDTAIIRQRIANQWKNAFNVSEDTPELNTEAETPAGQLIDGQAALISEKDSEILHLANSFNPETATGVAQDALAKIYFLERKVAQPTYVTCQCNGLQGTMIPYGAVVESTNGYQFYNTTPKTIPASGTVSCVFRCSEYGAIEIGSNIVTKIITVIPNWDSVNNSAAGVTGRDVETQSEFEIRRRASVAKNSHGLAESVEGTVNNLSGVVACRVEQNRGDVAVTKMGVSIPPHSIYLSVYGGTQSEIGTVIHEKLDAGCGTTGNTTVTVTDPTNASEHTYYYEIPTTKDFAVKVTYQATDTTPTNVADLIKQAVVDNFNGLSSYPRVKMGDSVYASRFYADVIACGVNNLQNIYIKYPSTDSWKSVKTVPLNEMPVMSTSNVTVVEVE